VAETPPSPGLAAAIRQIRHREGLTQEELAANAGLHFTFISRIERGERDPSWSSVQSVARGLSVSVLELVALAERIELD
jgi:transcriptional regulator with XRE-family HTH domain